MIEECEDMMKTIIIAFLCSLSFNVFAYDHFYSVCGINQNGERVEGGIFSINGETTLRGNLTDVNGDSHSFEGHYSGNGQMSGDTDDGDTVYLYINQPSSCIQCND